MARTCHRYCTAFVLDTAKPLTIAVTAVDATDSPIDAVERVLDRVDALPFEIKCLLADRGFYTERVTDALAGQHRSFCRLSLAGNG